jgi:hypothetical protein
MISTKFLVRPGRRTRMGASLKQALSSNSRSVITGNTFTDAPTIRVVEKKCGAELK